MHLIQNYHIYKYVITSKLNIKYQNYVYYSFDLILGLRAYDLLDRIVEKHDHTLSHSSYVRNTQSAD